ncbi:TauD/TfdA family dioxygenase [Paraburkholderia sp. RL17-347-BIC-D]|uniref:TauD/TfdA family dioxygenase n=1 Tax=Paraburkholderia sp. RL17-347-BIC-D TaxID=3031632 RepID=UPI0038B88B7F
MTPAQANALVDAARRWDGRDFRSLGRDEAASALETLVPTAHAVRTELGDRGFALVRGVPIDALTDGQIQLAYWAVGLLFGQGLTQNAKADFLCPVTDMGVDFGYSGDASQRNVRGYQSKADLNYHCDPTDVVALLCVRKALSGGLSTIVSTPAIFNEILRDHPQHLPVLLNGLRYDRKAEQWSGEEPVSERIPVFAQHGARVSCRYARSYIIGGAQKTQPLSDAQQAALDCFDAIACRADMPLHMAFEPGDIQLLNNYTVVHGRTAYEDDADPTRRRFLWRLWLHLDAQAPWCDESEIMRWAFARFGNLGRSVDEWNKLAETIGENRAAVF